MDNLERAFYVKILEQKMEVYRNNFLEFVKYMFKEAMKMEWEDNWHYDLIAKELQDIEKQKNNKLIICQPPRSGKTIVNSILYPIWRLGKDPKCQILVCGYSATLTQTFSQQAKDLYLSEAFQRVFPTRSEIRDDQNTKDHWVLQSGGRLYSTGSQGSITGLGFDLIICDDLLKANEAESETVRTGVNNWYLNTIPSRLNDPKRGAIIVICQRLHDDDIVGMLTSRDNGNEWKRVILPAIAVKDELPYRKEGEPLQNDRGGKEGRFNLDKLNRIKADVSPDVWSCQYQQDPVSSSNRVFYREWFRYFDHMQDGMIYIACDPAGNDSGTSGDFASIAVGRFVGDSLYIEDIIYGKWKDHELIQQLVNSISKWNPISLGIESVGFQRFIKYALEVELNKKGIHCYIEEIKQGIAGKNTATKIRRLEPLYRNGHIYHKRNANYLSEYEGELERFPKGKHDDLIDSVQMLYELSPLITQIDKNAKVYFGQDDEYMVEYDEFGRPR